MSSLVFPYLCSLQQSYPYFFTQSYPSFLNTCPIHLSLLHLITSLIFSMPILSLSSAFVFFSLSDTPHIHLTILISASFQLSQVLLPAQHLLPMFHFHISLNFEHMPHTLSLLMSMLPSYLSKYLTTFSSHILLLKLMPALILLLYSTYHPGRGIC